MLHALEFIGKAPVCLYQFTPQNTAIAHARSRDKQNIQKIIVAPSMKKVADNAFSWLTHRQSNYPDRIKEKTLYDFFPILSHIITSLRSLNRA
jgi:hypothetical protein